jgi:hypothetical protein
MTEILIAAGLFYALGLPLAHVALHSAEVPVRGEIDDGDPLSRSERLLMLVLWPVTSVALIAYSCRTWREERAFRGRSLQSSPKLIAADRPWPSLSLAGSRDCSDVMLRPQS